MDELDNSSPAADASPDDILGIKQTEAEEVKQYLDEWTITRSFDENARKQYAIDRRFASGKADLSWAVDANLLGNYIDILVAFLYARNPSPQIRPAERVTKTPNAKALELVMQQLMSSMGVGAGAIPGAAGPVAPLPPPIAADPMSTAAAGPSMVPGAGAMQAPGAAPPGGSAAPVPTGGGMLPPGILGSGPSSDEQDFAKTLEIVVKRLWRDGGLKKAMKKVVRSSLSVGPGWLKAPWLTDTRQDPDVQTALNDMRDNLAAVVAKQREITAIETGQEGIEIPPGVDVLAIKRRELQDLINGLESKVEVVVRKGLVCDFVRAENITVSLDVEDICDYLEASWIAHDFYIRKSELIEKYPDLEPADLKAATCYKQKKPDDSLSLEGVDRIEGTRADDASAYTKSEGGASASTLPNGLKEIEFVHVIEFWCRKDNHIRTVVEGVKKWARRPFVPSVASSRFYAFFLVAFFPVDGERHPQSLSWRLRKLQEEYAASRSAWRLTRERSIPGTIANGSLLRPEDARKIEGATHQEIIVVEPENPTTPLSDIFIEKPVAKVDPAVFDNSLIIGDMEKISGVQEALTTSQTIQKTATQADIEQTGFLSRSSSLRDVVEEMLADLAIYTVEGALQVLTTSEAQRYAGEECFWPEGLPREEILRLVDIDIEAGSTGRPNQEAEREAWAIALPQIEKMIVSVLQARSMGNEPLAQIYIELVRETLRRWEDRIDVERFVPLLEALAPTTAPGVDPLTGAPMAGEPEGEGGGVGADGAPPPEASDVVPPGSGPLPQHTSFV